MYHRPHNFLSLFFGMVALIGLSTASVPAATMFATTVNNTLISFDSSNACSIQSSVKITGLADDEQILGIDFRPATGELYGLGSSSRLYVIDTLTGFAMAIGSGPFSPVLEGSSFGIDFNPTVDRIRIVSDSGQNLRAHPDLGTIVFIDGTLSFVMGDVNEGAAPNAVASAYTNNDANPATGTTLYNLDSALDILVSQVPPNEGGLNTIGSLGVGTNDLAGFDILTTFEGSGNVNTAFAALMVDGRSRNGGRTCGSSGFFGVDLMSGAVTSEGFIGVPQPVLGLAAQPVMMMGSFGR